MKKLVLILFFLLFTTSAIAGVTLLYEVEETGASHSIFVDGASKHTVQVYFTNSGGSVTALTIALEGSVDRAHWESLATHPFSSAELTAKQAMFHVVNAPVDYVRLNITTLTETGNTAVTAIYMGEK